MKRWPTAGLAGALAAAGLAWAQGGPAELGGAGRPGAAPAAAAERAAPAAAESRERLDAAFVAFRGDAGAGQRVASGGTRAGPGAACFNCHGLHGEGDTSGAFPRLAGQPAYYLYKQLENYADGSRPNGTMTPIAVQLSPEQRRDVAAYYATLDAPHRVPAGLDPGLAQAGGALAAVGSAPLGVQSCVSCHGPLGHGMPPDVPYLAGQNVRYLEFQLQQWNAGRRTNDPLGVMADIARRLPPEQQRAVAVYFASLPPPANRAP
jgi:cytochrome c553